MSFWYCDSRGQQSDPVTSWLFTKMLTIQFSITFFFFLEMRQKFDAGEDPLDPESQQGGGGGQQGWPFHFNPFESGGSFHFKFQYN